ncbi:MAG: Type IV pilus biogenesis protein PilM [uncultured Thiotrichaceae bacterium]|uniref:Type IV pilus biogenesis protein PilM n=1 Tax=uncultured Thiotrichaceae bacterium TaxID=298394 RepID=A0A6S6U1T6_9GAMM|nr:MAG: Type IV pilus biogenesis protein PilM [uncultured Thiotrichaceae bacterium]
MFSIGRNKGNLLGIDISSSAVKLIELSKSGKGYRLESYNVAPLPEGAAQERDLLNPEPIGEAIKAVVKRSKTKTRSCALGIPSSVAISKIITLPASIPSNELESSITLEAEQHIPYPMDEVNFDFEILGESKNSQESIDVLLAATRKENVEMRVAAAELAGLHVEVVDLESHALELLFSKLVEDIDDQSVIGVVDFGASMTGMTVFEYGKVAFSREQAFGGKELTEEIMQRYGLTFQESGLAKKKGDLPEGYIPEVLDPFKDNMVRQVNRFLQFYYASTQQAQVDKILLSGGSASISGIDDQIQSSVGIPTQLVNPFAEMTLSPRINPARFTNDIPAMLVATGLSLRGIE